MVIILLIQKSSTRCSEILKGLSQESGLAKSSGRVSTLKEVLSIDITLESTLSYSHIYFIINWTIDIQKEGSST